MYNTVIKPLLILAVAIIVVANAIGLDFSK